ncbi:MAG: CvpA family protein [Thermodesulfobacteriota bacterium]|nr:CvpA family protein [Thermodesulfobacteriota bacterium]
MNIFDIIVVVILSFCLIRGFMIGMVRQVSSIVGVLAGFFAGIRYYPLLTGVLKRWIENPGYQDIAAFMIIFCGVFILVVLLAWVIHYLMKVSKIGWLDRVLGVVFGGVKALLVAAIILIALTTFLPSNASVVQGSRLARYLMPLSEKITLVVTHEVKSRYDKNIGNYIKTWKKQ